MRGRSTPIAQRKGPVQRRTREEFDQVAQAVCGQAVLDAIKTLVEKAQTLGGFESLGTSEANPALYLNFRTNGGTPLYWPFVLMPRQARPVVKIRGLRAHPALAGEDVLDQLLERVVTAAASPTHGNADGAPWVPLATLANPGVVDKLAEVLHWVVSTADGEHEAGSAASDGMPEIAVGDPDF